MGLSNGESDKLDTSDRPSYDYDNTWETVLTTSCVSAIYAYMADITQIQPSTSPEQGRKNGIAINMLKTIVGRASEKEARHVEETHKMTFSVWEHACY